MGSLPPINWGFLLQVNGELGRQRQKARFLLMAPRLTSGLKFSQIYHNPTWRRKKKH